jgi:hypothetical protein
MPLTSLEIDAAFAGGNIHVEKIENDQIWLRHEQRDTANPWFYWSFRVRGGANRTLRFHFTDGDVIGVRGAAFSADGGQSWEWLGEETVSRTESLPSFQVTLEEGQNEVHLSFCPLYTERNLHSFLKTRGQFLELQTLCQTKQGRNVELVRLNGNPNAPHRILLTGRHHCCEAMASFALEGLLESASGNDETGQWFRENVDLVAVPFMDKDGVENGDQGKARLPHDHNRDYNGTPDDSIYPEVRALRQFAPLWLEGAQTRHSIDFHCPWIRSGANEKLYFVGQPDQNAREKTIEFGKVLEKVLSGPIPYQITNDIPFGVDWNVGGNYAGISNTSWFCALPVTDFGVSLEVPYANADGVPVTPDNARQVGKDIAVAIKTYLSGLAK